MSDSSDIDFSDDDAIFEQRKQQLIAEQQQQLAQSQSPFADPAFAAQFDPKSPTYHGNYDPRVVNATGGNNLPQELQKQYGKSSISIQDMPDINDNVFNEDPTQFGQLYTQLFKLRELSLDLKRVFARLQGLLQEYLRVTESSGLAQLPQQPQPDNQSTQQKQLTQRLVVATKNLEIAMDSIKRLLGQWDGLVAPLSQYTKDELIAAGIKDGVFPYIDFDVKRHSRNINSTLTSIDTLMKINDTNEKLAQEQDLYFDMKRYTTELMARQQDVLATMKIVKKNYQVKKDRD